MRFLFLVPPSAVANMEMISPKTPTLVERPKRNVTKKWDPDFVDSGHAKDSSLYAIQYLVI